ncbi:putative cue domain-containing protein [Erysiphe necator]|uniref:Putative cue domain-containing protein n=1 Tax=Uncinula necator TaxID=52586 RepID=A0A0B1P8M8_UNCNE|nr:putative cue domain-containing protein [Erysiphe necator]
MSQQLPPMAPYPEEDWVAHIAPAEWEACLDSWIAIGGAHLALSDSAFHDISLNDESLSAFLTTFVANQFKKTSKSESHDGHRFLIRDPSKLKPVRKICFLLSCRLLETKTSTTPLVLLTWEFLADSYKIFGRNHTRKLYSLANTNHSSTLESSVMSLKNSLIKELDAGINGDLVKTELQLKKLNHLLYICPEVAQFFMAGSDYLDALISCYKIMNPPLRKTIILNVYLCLIGLTKDQDPNFSLLVDQLYSLKAAAEAHLDSIYNADDSLVPELITITPILKKLEKRMSIDGNGSGRAKYILSALQSFRKRGKSMKSQNPVKRKLEKGKKKVVATHEYRFDVDEQSQVQRLSLISQVQELFPDLGSGFISRILNEYDDNLEVVISHILEGSLPHYLNEIERSEKLKSPPEIASTQGLKADKTYPTLPIRHNVFDDDQFDRGEIDPSRVHFGYRDSSQTAENLLDNRSLDLKKEAIFSALAAFDLNDDERDDTYDFADVGGTVDTTHPEDELEAQTNNSSQIVYNEILFRAYKMNPQLFKRDSAVRRGRDREKLRKQVGLTDEVIEGWALMLIRDPKLLRRLEAKFDGPGNSQRKVVLPSWKDHDSREIDDRLPSGLENKKQVNLAHSGVKKYGAENNENRDFRTGRGGKGSNEGSRANHNRKRQRAKKVAKAFSGPEA